jgi:predicted acyltransferase
MLAVFYLVIDCIGLRWWAFPLVVVGMNSIAVYCMESLIRGWIAKMFGTHLNVPMKMTLERMSREPAEQWYGFAGVYGPIVQSAAVFLVIWLICLWMYRRKIFLRI